MFTLPVNGASSSLRNDRSHLDVRPRDNPFGVDFGHFVLALLLLKMDDARLAVTRCRRRRRSLEPSVVQETIRDDLDGEPIGDSWNGNGQRSR